MSLVRRALPERRSTKPPAIPGPLEGMGADSAAGEVVTYETAMRHAAVHFCVNLIANTVSSFEVEAYRGGVEMETLPRILANPSPGTSITGKGWRRQVLVSWLMRGNAYGFVLESTAGYPTNVEVRHPDEFQWGWTSDRGWRLYWMGLPVETLPLDVLHWPAQTMPGQPFGLSPLSDARQAVGLGLAVEKFGAQWFGNGAHPSAILSAPGEVKDGPARVLKNRFKAAARDREPVVLSHGVKYDAIQVSPEESQFLETIKANRTTIALFYGVPPDMAGGEVSNSMTYSNRQDRNLDFLTYTAGTWAARMDEVLTDLLPRPQRACLEPSNLLRLDAKTQTDVAVARVRGGLASRDEGRDLVGLPPIGGEEGALMVWPPFASSTPTMPDRTDPAAVDPAHDPAVLDPAGTDPAADEPVDA